MKARPANAGFIKFDPIPPNNCFTIIIENTDPIIIIGIGSVTGTLNANNIPVTTADKSLIVEGCFIIF